MRCGAAGAAGGRSGWSASAAWGELDGTHQEPVGKGWKEKGGRGKGASRKDDQAPLQTPACKGPAQTVFIGGLDPHQFQSKEELLEILRPFGRIVTCVFKVKVAFVTFECKVDTEKSANFYPLP